MFRSFSIVVGLLVLVLPVAMPAAAQTSEELQKQIESLTRRVEALEKRNKAAQSQSNAAASAQARQEAQALYGKIDVLLGDGKVDEAHQAVAAFDEKYKGTPGANWTRSLKREMEVVGKATPEEWFIEKWYQGESEVDLDDGKPTLVIFWESWCPHCRNEVPKMQKLHEELGAKGLQVVGVTRITKTATEDSVKEFIAGNDVSYPMAKETGALAEYFNVKGIPAAAVVKNGKIIWRGHPLRLTEELIGNWL